MRLTAMISAGLLLGCTKPPPAEVTCKPAPVAATIDGALEVAVTVDDLPRHGPEIPGLTQLAIHETLLTAFRDHHLPPVYGFINTGKLEGHPEDRAALEAWRRSGNPLGNHTFSHADLQTKTLSEYFADITANEPILRELAPDQDPQSWKVFRFPYLREGTDLPSRQAIREFLSGAGYRTAEVTVDFVDYAYNPAYARCLAKHDDLALAALEETFLDHAYVFLRWADAASRALFGRRIPQVLLIHAGAFTAKMADRLLSRYEQSHVRFVSLDRAMADPVYSEEPKQAKVWSGTFLWQVRKAREQFDPPQPSPPDELLGVLCR